jgi:hypothetical protein
MNTTELQNVSLSEGTMRAEDLIPCFISALRSIDADNNGLMLSLEQLEADMQNEDYFDTDSAQLDLDYLFDTLNQYAPDDYYFGSHPGDGCDYGFWQCEAS